MIKLSRGSWVVGIGASVLIALGAGATPANKVALERHFGTFLPKAMRNCSTCHQPTDKKDPESLEEIPHNPFGAALRKAGSQLRSEGKKREMSARLDIVAGQDSDGDGVDNLTELLLGHNPGMATDVPSKEELARTGERRGQVAAVPKANRSRPLWTGGRPAIPSVEDAAWVRNPIDAFVLEQQRAHGVTHLAEAPRGVLLRRVYLDLVGLNPTPEEMAAFEEDASGDAYERLVDRLLADPRYG